MQIRRDDLIQAKLNETDILNWISTATTQAGDELKPDELRNPALTITRNGKQFTTRPGDTITVSATIDHTPWSMRSRREATNNATPKHTTQGPWTANVTEKDRIPPTNPLDRSKAMTNPKGITK